jgi:hypothetical protein
MLFRTSSTSVTRAFADVPHPHGSVLSSDAFARGLIRSGTDFSVYVTQGLKGLDLAFYRPRSLYHTKGDSVPNLGGTDALWNMMESSLISGIALTESIPVADDNNPAVYFDGMHALAPRHTFLTIVPQYLERYWLFSLYGHSSSSTSSSSLSDLYWWQLVSHSFILKGSFTGP